MYRVEFIEGEKFEAEYLERSCEEIIELAAKFLYTEWKVPGDYQIIKDTYEPVIKGNIYPLYADGVVYRDNIPNYVTDLTIIDCDQQRHVYTVGLTELGNSMVLACICCSYLDILQADYIKEVDDNDCAQAYSDDLYNRESHFLIKRY